MDLLPPKPAQVVSAASNVAHKLLYGGLADLRPMPRTLIEDGELREVYHYRPAADTTESGDPILLVTPLAAPAICFDLRRGCSLVEHFVAQGRPTYLVEYGEVSFKNRSLGMEHWVDEVLPEAIKAVSEHAGGRPVHVIGWSLGGIFALLTAADQPALPIASLTVVGSPVDVKKVPLMAPVRPLLNLNFTEGRGLITRGYQAMGGIPKPLVNWAFTAASAQKVITKPLAVLTNLDDADYLAQLEAVDRFSANMIAYPGRTFGQLYHRMVKGNALAQGLDELRRPDDPAVVDQGPGARVRRRDRRHRAGQGREGRRAAAHRIGRGPLRDRPRWPPRHAHRPRGPRLDLAGDGRVDRPVVGPGREAAGEEEGHEGCCEEDGGEEEGRRPRGHRGQPQPPLRLRGLALAGSLSGGST